LPLPSPPDLSGDPPPGGEAAVSGPNRLPGLPGPTVRHLRQQPPAGRVLHREPRRAIGLQPAAADIGLGVEQPGARPARVTPRARLGVGEGAGRHPQRPESEAEAEPLLQHLPGVRRDTQLSAPLSGSHSKTLLMFTKHQQSTDPFTDYSFLTMFSQCSSIKLTEVLIQLHNL
ncbi:hypothetical protein chiPu_0030832, partial [Chiloscyllium punctatum]|nr:hypothetical protein [Chiloscyllium punctatum]